MSSEQFVVLYFVLPNCSYPPANMLDSQYESPARFVQQGRSQRLAQTRATGITTPRPSLIRPAGSASVPARCPMPGGLSALLPEVGATMPDGGISAASPVTLSPMTRSVEFRPEKSLRQSS
ncbi:hypothetical protein AL036_07955 [Salipiger aestuarii]|nr:hypothetical protein AL036_07955 [Salipiger aestuarii]